MKIRDVKVYLAPVEPSNPACKRGCLYAKVETDEGIWGIGEGSCMAGAGGKTSWIIGQAILYPIKETLIGKDPFDTEAIWDHIYYSFFYPNPRGIITSAIAAIDIALWDIKGKALGLPIYKLLGGKYRGRESIILYANGFAPGKSPNDGDDAHEEPHLEHLRQATKRIMDAGFTAIKTDPYYGLGSNTAFVPHGGGYMTRAGIDKGVKRMAAIREAGAWAGI